MARELNKAGDVDSDIFRISGRDLPAKLQIIGANETAQIHVAGDGTTKETALATMEQYKRAGAAQIIDRSNDNAIALDTVGIYQIKGKSGGVARIHLSTPGDL